MKIKNVILTMLLVCTLRTNIEAMKEGYNPFKDLSISELLNQMDPAFPISCLRCVTYLARTNHLHDATVLNHIENVIINSLIRFHNQNINLNHNNGRDLVCACAAFKILTGVRRRSPNFCNVQYGSVCNFLTTHEIITEQEIQQSHWDPCEAGALLNAVMGEDLRASVRAIAAGTDINATINNPGSVYHGMTALHLAVEIGSINIIHALIVAGVNIHTIMNKPGQKDHGVTALHLAVWTNKADATRVLIDAGADIHTTIDNPGQISHGWATLHFAIFAKSTDAIQTLIAAGAQVPASLVSRLQQLGINVPENQIVR